MLLKRYTKKILYGDYIIEAKRITNSGCPGLLGCKYYDKYTDSCMADEMGNIRWHFCLTQKGAYMYQPYKVKEINDVTEDI